MGALSDLAHYTYALFRPPKKQTVSEWADANRVLVSESSAEPGQWRTDRAPYQREIMDAFTQPGVWQIVIMSSAQVGKSEIELNMMGCAIDNDPGPMLYIQPTDKVAEDYSKRRIAPMIQACRHLRDKVFKARSRDAANTITMKTFPGGSLAIIGANSPADLSSKPVRYIFMDETDRFPQSAGTEGDPQELAERRTETYRHNRKIIKTSTPTIKGQSRIEADYMNGTQEEWHTQCPYCGKFTFIRFDDIRFEKETFTNESGDEDYKVKRVVWRCPVCEHEIDEHKCKRLPAKWVAKNPQALQNGIRSFRLNAFMSPWSDWRDIVWKFWEMRIENGLEEALFNRREHYAAEVPAGVLVLTCGIDTQDNRLEYEVVGWDRNGQSWGISRGVIPGRADTREVWDEVDELLDREWTLPNGLKLRILATFIDSGGHFTTQVYKECARRASRRIWPIKGEKGEGKPECRPMTRNHGDGAKFMLGVDAGKEGIMYEAQVQEPGPNYMHFPTEPRAGYSMDYFRGLISERMEIHRKGGRASVVWVQYRDRNEPLDCRNYARAAYRYFNWQFDKLEMYVNGEEAPKKIMTSAEKEKKSARRRVSAGIRV